MNASFGIEKYEVGLTTPLATEQYQIYYVLYRIIRFWDSLSKLGWDYSKPVLVEFGYTFNNLGDKFVFANQLDK